MFHFYDGYHWFGMHLFWWAFWILFLVVVFLVRAGPEEPQTDGYAALNAFCSTQGGRA